MYILVNSKEEGNIIINTINSELFTFLIQICQWGNFRNKASLFTYFKYLDFNIINNSKIDNEFINIYYKLSEDEINFLKNFNHKKNVKNTNIKNDEIISGVQCNKIITVSKKKTLKRKMETTITNEDKEIEIEKNIDNELNDFKVSKKKTSK